MNYFLGQTETDIGSVRFEMNASNFEIWTPKRTFTVYDDDIEEVDGIFVFHIPDNVTSGFQNVREIEIPAYILDRKAEILKEIEAGKNSIGSTETPQGKVYFYLTEDGKVRAKLGELEEITEIFYTIEGKRVMLFPGLDIPFVVLPEGVEKAYWQAKRKREHKNMHLVYAGRSLLTGKDYYRLSCDVSRDAMNRVKEQFEHFEPGDVGTLEGWLTSEPERVEQYLRIRNPISNRKAEIEKQRAAAIKANEKIIKKMMTSKDSLKLT
jgi:hypothetical protein